MVTKSLEQLAAESNKVYVEAPAGCGKTHFIVSSIQKHCIGRQLVLTHTYAGVSALRNHFEKASAEKGKYKVDTIAGFCLDYVKGYPATCGLSLPETTRDVSWKAVYEAFAKLISKGFFKKIVKASIKGIYVDEYQDCSIYQHQIVLSLSEIIPVRVLGDPLQAIFDFRKDDPSIEWSKDVETVFKKLDDLKTPHRWINSGNSELGNWLIQKVRPAIKRNIAVPFSDKPRCVFEKSMKGFEKDPMQFQSEVCRSIRIENGETLVIISGGKHKHVSVALSKRLAGRFHHSETMDCPELMDIAKEYDASPPGKRGFLIASLATKWISNIGKALPESVLNGNLPRPKGKHSDLYTWLSVHHPNSHISILESLRANSDCNVYRREIHFELLNGLRSLSLGRSPTLLEGVVAARDFTRRAGRRPFFRTIGRTLIIKGLEFDHAVIVGFQGMSPYEQYVALTRAKKSITIFVP